MKKHNEGYTLVYVLVVLVVLCLLTAAVLSSAIRNLHFQQKVAETVCDKYTIQGEIARIRLQLEAMNDSGNIDLNNNFDSGVQIVVVENIVVVRARSGQTQGDCILVLKDAIGSGNNTVEVSIKDEDKNGVYNVTNLGGVECIYYEIYTVEEVAADDGKPETFVPDPEDSQNQKGSGSE